MFVIGLTGGIGSGKSTVAEMFSRLGATVIDTDMLSRQVTQPNTPGLMQIVQHFGNAFLKDDGTLNRAALRKQIFSQPEDRIWLEKLLHPLIREAMHQEISASLTPYCIVVIPLLTEFKPDPIIQRTLVVDTTPELQIKRVLQRDQHNAGDIPTILKIQSTREKRLQLADDVICNDGPPEALSAAVEALHLSYLKLAEIYPD